jgi:hypothetical protein
VIARVSCAEIVSDSLKIANGRFFERGFRSWRGGYMA